MSKVLKNHFFVSHVKKKKIKPHTGVEWHEGDIIYHGFQLHSWIKESSVSHRESEVCLGMLVV